MSDSGDGNAPSSAPAPRANPDLFGHEAAERELNRLLAAGRLPHALLICGPRGIGKATLAFRLARYVLARAGETGGEPDRFGAGQGGLAIPADSGTFRRVAAGGHADLLTVERAWDPRRRRLRGEIVVDDARQIGQFLRLTPAEGGWRVVVVDGADEMNRNAANALLKVLEEPPNRALLLLVAHSPGRLLPTIRSRCRRLALAPLKPVMIRRLLARYRADLAEPQAEELAALAEGSIGRALELAAAGGVELYRAVMALLSREEGVDPLALHAFADKLARAEADDAYRATAELLAQILAGLAVARAGGGIAAVPRLDRLAGRAPAARWARLRTEIEENFARTEGLNLDRKQAVLGAFFAIAAAAE
ncbi:MAG TPA: DNA polymerase III subunit delta' [Stellaceae bacterium]|nr:DNA polymerase III subunit delta' [Stellaceae bacterium]